MIRFLTYELTQEQQILRETVSEFAQSEISPLASKIDEERTIPKELLAKIVPFGLYSITVPTEFGGAGADFVSLVIAMEEISRASASVGAVLSYQNAVVCEALSNSQSENSKELLPMLAAGSIGAFDLDPSREEPISCKIEDSTLTVNGSSEFVVGASFADIFLVLGELKEKEQVIFAFSKNAFPKEQFKVGEQRRLLGMRGCGASSIAFKAAKLPLKSLAYEVSKTKTELAKLLCKARLATASQALGIAQASVDASIKYARERKQFNTKIGNFYAVQDMIASDSIALETSRAQTYLAAKEMNSPSLEKDSSIAKISASDAAVKAARHSIRIHGGYGFTRDYPVERYARDAHLTKIYNESNEELKATIAKYLLGPM